MAASRKRFAVCLRIEGYEVSLEKRNGCAVLPEFRAASDQIRVTR